MKVIVAALLLLSSSFAFAQGPCDKDHESFCQGLKPGHGLMKCMKENEAKLSAECKAHREEMKAKVGELKAACEGDAAKLCPDSQGRERMKCLREKKAEVSPACLAEWKELKEARKAARKH
ncbi:MAG: hypothetical protein EOP11_02305 [Proteobacteria bacterium]|nr:MAG: hypothetical protein EOP11_02305 [Pseudomonadota bacterium]